MDYREKRQAWLDSPLVSEDEKKYIREVKFEDVKLSEDASDSEDENIIICAGQTELDAALTQKCEDMYAAGADLPSVTIEVTMINLSKTEQYKDFADLVSVGLGDTVHCYNYKLGITTDARVIKLTWDCIRNQAGEMTLGDYEYNYFSELTSSLQAIQQVIGPGNTLIAERVSGVLNAINTQLRYQKNVAQTADVRAILFEDTNPNSPTYGAMCLGTQGFQIADSQTADGRDWDWTTAFTAKGGYADTIIAGLLSDKTGRSYWNLDTGELQLSGDFMQRAENGELSVSIADNQVRFYSWEDNGEYCGSVGAVKDDATGDDGVEMWCDAGKYLVLGCARTAGSNKNIKRIFHYDDQKPDDTPYIINTASGGNIFENLPGGGITIQNGLVKKWDTRGVASGYFTTSGWRVEVTDGLITKIQVT